MSVIQVHRFDAPCEPVETYFLPADKLVAGNPRQSLWKRHADASGQFFTGIWQSEPGKWRIAYTEEEYCQILAGHSIITDAQGSAVTVTPGDSFVIPKGFTGTWEVVELTRKIYVIYEAQA